jgi:hypothetical protein
MSEAVSLASVRSRLPDSAKPLRATNPTAALNNVINRVAERFFDSGKWEGTTETATINIYGNTTDDYYITLPRHLSACIRGGRAGYVVPETQGMWYQFLGGGRGLRGVDDLHTGPLQDLGFGFCLYRNLPATGSKITIQSDSSIDAGDATDGIVVSGAGTEAANGTYTLRDEFDGKPFYNKLGLDENTIMGVILWDGIWGIYGQLGDLLYTSTEDVATPDLVTTWSVGDDLVSDTPVPSVDSATEHSTFIWIRGRDTSGNKIFSTVDGERIEGVKYPVSNTAVETDETFASVYSVVKSVTAGSVTLTDEDDNAIAVYEPGETEPNYRRYLSGGYLADEWTSIKGLFKRRHVWATHDNDPVYPATLEAIKLGILALNAEEQGNLEQAQYYEGRAIALLNARLSESNAGITTNLQQKRGGGRIAQVY